MYVLKHDLRTILCFLGNSNVIRDVCNKPGKSYRSHPKNKHYFVRCLNGKAIDCSPCAAPLVFSEQCQGCRRRLTGKQMI